MTRLFLLFSVLLLLCFACKSLAPNLNLNDNSSLNDDFSFCLPGKSLAPALQKLGQPDLRPDPMLVFKQWGIILYTSPNKQTITGAVGSWFPGHGRFMGKWLGIGIGDTFPKLIKMWGKPLSRISAEHGFDEAIWIVSRYRLTIEIWNANDFEPDLGGNIMAETVKRIHITLK
jgi:hypothetical protein